MEDTAMRSGSYPLIDDGLYKVLLVDDEEVVRHGLRYMLDWKTLGFRMPRQKINPNSLSYKSKFEFADNGALSGTRTLGPLIKSQLL